jgi:hypothetical protein
MMIPVYHFVAIPLYSGNLLTKMLVCRWEEQGAIHAQRGAGFAQTEAGDGESACAVAVGAVVSIYVPATEIHHATGSCAVSQANCV